MKNTYLRHSCAFKKIAGLFLLFFVWLKPVISQNMWSDKATVESIKTGIHACYNFEFEKAEAISKKVLEKYPDHPAGLMFEALILHWKYYPLMADSETGKRFENLLQKSIAASESEVQNMPNHQLTRFFAMMPRLMLVEYYADNGQAYRSAPHLTSVYKSIVHGFDFIQTTPEFYFTTGLYNYYREAYPESNPIYKPIVFFFPDGNKQEGLSELYTCWQKSEFIGPEAMFFLSYIYINFETNYTIGIAYANELMLQYPNNPLFAELCIQLLLLDKQYEKAEQIINRIKGNTAHNSFFQTTITIYDAVIKEQKHANLLGSENAYHSAIKSISKYGNFSKRYLAYAYFGLSRIYKYKGQNNESQRYHSLAKEVAQYPHVNFN